MENTLNRLNEKLYQGVLPAPGSLEILVNIDVAERMNLKPGDRIRLSAHAPNQSRIDYTARISGVISDEQLPGSALTDLDALSRRLGIPGRAERLNLIFQRRLTDEEAAGILGLFQKAGLPARSWKSDSPIYQMIESGKPIIDIYLFFFFFLAGLVALNTALINLFQQRRSIGILLAMGYSRGRVAANFLTEQLILSASSGLLGILIGSFLTIGFQGMWGGLPLPEDYRTYISQSLVPLVLTFRNS